ncbi:hypothetical protein [Roseiconus lacunae]|uniref:hypothetical protein n=1 Tax=Roseiconus lacunae TaxID=2605694 RepID=UPI001E3A3797|nr:hypothetical protein [Roseiconus lacunae]MCD0462087.1 hypothetical protein [Roseiconus lacunae]
MKLTQVNPFYAGRVTRPAANTAELPVIPRNASPVPHLTSLYHFSDAGDYGDRSYPGNCGGNIIRDLLCYFKPGNVFDPMTGSGTCRDVCRELHIPCLSTDLKGGFDACDANGYSIEQRFDFIWAHPPYWRQKLYSDSPSCLSQTKTVDEFNHRYGQFIQNCADILTPGGKLAVLMGDYSDRQAGYVPLVYHTKELAFKAGLQQHCTDIIRFSHGATSSRKVYRSSFIPGLHDVCMIFAKPKRGNQ